MSVDAEVAQREIRGKGIGPVSAKWMQGARMVQAAFERSKAGYEDARFDLDRAIRIAPFENLMLPFLQTLQGADREIIAGFAAVLTHVIQLVDGSGCDAEHIESLLRTAVVTR